ncbi:MAG TPA: cytochrome P450 [Roseiflexaceae bacterium]|nr:cytochrome P450 [Roseiflexaceae bacterium]
MTTVEDIPFWSAEFKRSSYETYAQMRAEGPIREVNLPNAQRGVWLITRYDDVLNVLKDPRFVKDWRNAMSQEEREQTVKIPESVQLLSQHMLGFDPPQHTRLRALVSKAFTPRYIERLRPRVQQIADELIDTLEGRGEIDLIEEFAFPLPITVIAEMLGVPVEDRAQFRVWSDVIVSGVPSKDRMQRLEEVTDAFTAYLRRLFAERRANPGDDLISGLLAAEEQGDRLSERELFGMVFLLLIAGHETTVNLIGNGMLALLTHPDQLELLRSRPELAETAIEEFLRYDGPVETSTLRYAREDVALGDVLIQRGSSVLVVLGSANRDEQRFAAADDLDITRADNRHVAFGYGIHYCLGAPLARLEGQIAFNTLLRRLPNLRLAVPLEQIAWRPSTLMHSLLTLPVAF